MMRAVSGSVVLYPSDANQAARLVAEMADHHGISYLRTTRENTPVIYSPDETFPIGGSRVVRGSSGDQATVVAAGVTLHEALTAHAQLAAEGIPIRVIDAYSVKPIDAGTLRQAAADTAGRLVVAEDHWPEGGLGDAVLSAFAGGPGPLPRVHQARRVRSPRIRQAGRDDRRRRHRQLRHRRRRQAPPLTGNRDHSEKCSAGACPPAKCRPAGHDHNEECRAGTRPHPWASRPANRKATKSP